MTSTNIREVTIDSYTIKGQFIRDITTEDTLRLLRSVYVWPVPTNIIGCPVVYVMEMAAPT